MLRVVRIDAVQVAEERTGSCGTVDGGPADEGNEGYVPLGDDDDILERYVELPFDDGGRGEDVAGPVLVRGPVVGCGDKAVLDLIAVGFDDLRRLLTEQEGGGRRRNPCRWLSGYFAEDDG